MACRMWMMSNGSCRQLTLRTATPPQRPSTGTAVSWRTPPLRALSVSTALMCYFYVCILNDAYRWRESEIMRVCLGWVMAAFPAASPFPPPPPHLPVSCSENNGSVLFNAVAIGNSHPHCHPPPDALTPVTHCLWHWLMPAYLMALCSLQRLACRRQYSEPVGHFVALLKHHYVMLPVDAQ